MYPDIPIWLSFAFIVLGLAVVAWSADVFIGAASAVARALGVSPFVIGMVVIGFGTSAPELCVSALSGMAGHSNLSLGNAFGSSIFNIACILGVAALIRPLAVKPAVVYVAAPALALIAALAGGLLRLGDGFSRLDGMALLGVFLVLLPLYCWFDQRTNGAPADAGAEKGSMSLPRAVCALVVGLALLIGSSHILVWGCVDVARVLGVSELLIGLTVVAVGTSLPELASAVASARRGEHEFVLGNIIGSNLFNTLAVVGLAGTISPFRDVSPYILRRDMPMLIALSLSIAVFGFSRRGNGSMTRLKGALWLLAFLAYAGFMIVQELQQAS